MRLASILAISAAMLAAPAAFGQTAPFPASIDASKPAASNVVNLAAPAAKPATPQAKADEIVCVEDAVTGSLFSQRICKTRAQLTAEGRLAEDAMRLDRGGGAWKTKAQ